MKWSRDLEELQITADFHAEALKQQPQALRDLARDEYRTAQERLSATALAA